ncbi:MAG: hypothetical protein AAB740_05395 [Patescibacteria group bacterium]
MTKSILNYKIDKTLGITIIFEEVALIIFKYFEIEANIIASLMTAIALFGGYFIIHNLEITRTQKIRKLELCLEMVKNLRLFLNEPYYNNKEEQKRFRDQFIDSYFQFSILVSKDAYIKLEAVVERFTKFLSNKDEGKAEEYKKEFKNSQNEFINQLRKELSDQEKIDFGAYAIEIPNDQKDKR